jgi:hypothetical protein
MTWLDDAGEDVLLMGEYILLETWGLVCKTEATSYRGHKPQRPLILLGIGYIGLYPHLAFDLDRTSL